MAFGVVAPAEGLLVRSERPEGRVGQPRATNTLSLWNRYVRCAEIALGYRVQSQPAFPFCRSSADPLAIDVGRTLGHGAASQRSQNECQRSQRMAVSAAPSFSEASLFARPWRRQPRSPADVRPTR